MVKIGRKARKIAIKKPNKRLEKVDSVEDNIVERLQERPKQIRVHFGLSEAQFAQKIHRSPVLSPMLRPGGVTFQTKR